MKRQNTASDKEPLYVDDLGKRKKDYDLRICTWNVRTLYRPGASSQLTAALEKYRADITAIQEMRWTGQGCIKQKSCDIYYSCHAERHEFGCGFVVGHRLRHLVSRFTPVNERLATIRVKAKFFNLTLICAHAPTEEKDEAVKDDFYARLENTYDRAPAHDIKIILGDFNAKVGKEAAFYPAIGKFSLHEETTDNGMRLIDFAAARNMVVSSTRFKHRDIHKATWLSPDQSTRNQIDHVVIDGRHVSSVLDVRSVRGANIDSDHYLVVAKFRTRICRANNARGSTLRKYDISKLQSQQTVTAYSARLSELLRQTTGDDIRSRWNHISHSICASAQEVLGFQSRRARNQWYDDECRMATAEKDAAYRKTLQSNATRAVREKYREKRREERRLFRRKKREQERREREELEQSRNRNDARKFYQQVKRLTEGFKPGAYTCKDEEGNLVTDAQRVLQIWKEHFSTLLSSDEATNPTQSGSSLSTILFDDVTVPPPSHEEVKIAIQRLKNNKAAGADNLSAELFKTGGEELIGSMHQLLSKIWLEESMPSEWSLSTICPILKKGDPGICANYRGISLIPIAYKVLSSVVCERLKPIAETLIGPYQCGFRPGKSTTDQIFTLRQILEKTHEYQINTCHLFVDFKSAFDSPIRDEVYTAMSEFGIPAKLIRLCRMTLSNSRSSVKVGSNLSEPFDTARGFRQGDPLSCALFNLILESVLRKSGVHRTGTIFNRSVQILCYADDIIIIGRTERDVSGAFAAIEKEARKVGLAVNEGKTKYMLSTCRESQRHGTTISLGGYTFERVKEFVYLGSAVNSKNNVSLEIKRRITLANRCYYGLSRQLSSRALSRRTKTTLYKTLILPVLLYGAEAWVVTQSDAAALGVFERKVLRKIFGPLRVGDDYRIRMNHELYELYDDIDVVQRISQQQLRWLGHVVRMDENAPARKVFDARVEGGRRRGRPKLRWRDQVEVHLSRLGVRNWRQRAMNRNAWRTVVGEAVTR